MAASIPSRTLRYGILWPEHWLDFDIELTAFRYGSPDRCPVVKQIKDPRKAIKWERLSEKKRFRAMELSGTTKQEHFKRIVGALWPVTGKKPFIFHPWADKMLDAACRETYLGVAGCGSSGKTEFFALWAIVNFICAPRDTMVLVTSTSLRESRRRIWGSIEDYWLAVPGLPGKLISSLGFIRFDDGTGNRTSSEKPGIHLIPGEKKKEKEAVGKLIGAKCPRVILIMDELPELSEALLTAGYSNLSTNPFFQMVGIGNPASYYDPFGVFVEPKDGWGSINVEDDEWPTERGRCIHFDGLKSPNFDQAEDKWPIYGRKQLAEHKNLGETTVSFWRMCRGFWCPTGDEESIWNEADIIRYGGGQGVVWEGLPTPVSALDPGFTNGGDESILYHGLWGKEAGSGKMVLLFTGYDKLRENVTKNDEARNYQIAHQFRDKSEAKRVIPKNAAFDATGGGIPFGDIVHTEWNREVLGVKFGGASTDRPFSEVNRKPASDQVTNRVTEIWYAGVEFLRNGQLRGIPPELARQLCERRLRTRKLGDLKLEAESKQDMKGRIGRSPDMADAAMILVDLVRERFGGSPGKTSSRVARKDWVKMARHFDVAAANYT